MVHCRPAHCIEKRSGREGDGQGPARGVQRRRLRDHHHDHGAGARAAPRRDLRGSARARADLPRVRPLVRHVGIYWTNHHHLLQAVRVVDGRVLWANLFLLFWLSLFPFTTAWMGENWLEPLPVALYGGVLLMAGV